MDEIHSAGNAAVQDKSLNPKTNTRGAAGTLSSGRWKARFIVLLVVAFIALSVFSAVYIFGLRFSYSVTYNGKKLGFVSDKTQAETVISNVEAKTAEILGSEYTLAENVETTLAITGKNTALDSKALERSMLEAVPETSRYYGVYVDGKLIGGMESGSEALEIVSETLNGFNHGYEVSSNFVQDISIVNRYAPAEYLLDADGLRAAINGSLEAAELNISQVYAASYAEAIPYETEFVDDPEMFVGETKVVTEGVEGSVTRFVEYELVDGMLKSRNLVGNEITANAVTEVVAVGSKAKPGYASTGSYIWPSSGPITSYFGPRSVSVGSSIHKGIDIGAQYGAPIIAADSGEIIYSDYMSGYGYLIQIRHGNGEVTYYAHCSELVGQVSEHVAQGELIAYVGNTGVSSGAHLHFEVRVENVPVNPLSVLP